MLARRWRRWVVVILFGLGGGALAADYDPLALSAAKLPAPLELQVQDSARERQIPLRVHLPPQREPRPVVLFSHGLGGARDNNPYLGEHWANRGYVVVFLQHPGSDTEVLREASPGDRRQTLTQAANVKNFKLRIDDVHAVIDALELWQDSAEHPLHGRLDLQRIGMSGHSFGAMTTQAVSGQHFRRGGADLSDARIDAALMLSPSAPRRGSAESAFAEVRLPWLLMTGTRDVSPIGDIDLEARLAVYPALPKGGKYELVLDGAAHTAFTQRGLPADGERNPNHHRVILALSTAFWDAYLGDDAGARRWLDGAGPRSVLQDADRWQHK